MGVTLQLKRGAAANHQIARQKRLKGDYRRLPQQGSARTDIDTPGRLSEPARRFIFAQEISGEPVSGKPGGIDRQTFWKVPRKPVQLLTILYTDGT